MAKRRRQEEAKPPEEEIGIPTQFFKIILSPHASQLHIPDKFVMKYGANLRDRVLLEVPSGAIWKVKLQNSNGMAWLKGGWNQFKEYYSIGCGYFLVFRYNGNSHFSVFIFDLSASEIEYPSGPNEDMTLENFVKIMGDASHGKKAFTPETKNNASDDILDDSLRKLRSGVADVEEDLYCAAQKEERKKIGKDKLGKQNIEKNLDRAADKEKGYDGVTLGKKQLPAATCQEKGVSFRGESQCSELGDRSFIVSMQPTYVCRSFQLNIPAAFSKRHFKEGDTVITLRVSDGRTWRVKCSCYSYSAKYKYSAKIQSAGWRDFVLGNRLKVHDTCAFELMEGIEPVLNVTIFRADGTNSTPHLQP